MNLEMLKPEMFVFDMDGLLVDSERFYSQGWKAAVDSLGYKLDDSVYDSWIGQGLKVTKQKLKEIVLEDDIVEHIVGLREKFIYEKLHSGEMMEMRYASAILSEVKNAGIKIGLSSSTARDRGEAILEFLNLYQFVDYASFGDDVDMVKPSPLVYQRTLDLSGIDSSKVIAVEDSYTGALAASNANLKVLVIPYVKFETNKIKQLEDVLVIGEDLRIIRDYL